VFGGGPYYDARVAEPLDAPGLPCPECRMRGVGGGCRIGNRRNKCRTCNRFAQHVRRSTWRQLVAVHREEFEQMRLAAERELYPVIAAQFDAQATR
jgi:hypothetical protein